MTMCLVYQVNACTLPILIVLYSDSTLYNENQYVNPGEVGPYVAGGNKSRAQGGGRMRENDIWQYGLGSVAIWQRI